MMKISFSIIILLWFDSNFSRYKRKRDKFKLNGNPSQDAISTIFLVLPFTKFFYIKLHTVNSVKRKAQSEICRSIRAFLTNFTVSTKRRERSYVREISYVCSQKKRNRLRWFFFFISREKDAVSMEHAIVFPSLILLFVRFVFVWETWQVNNLILTIFKTFPIIIQN